MILPGKRCAIYERVSTDAQDAANQRPAIDSVIRTRGLTIVGEYRETVSAAKRRPEHDRMMTDARRGRFDVLVVWALDRLGRSMTGNLRDVLELDRVGVQIVSVQEPWLDTGSPVRDLLVAIFSWVAEQERRRLIERTKAGLDAARCRGQRLGRRPKVVRLDVARVVELRDAGQSLRSIALSLDVDPATLRRALARSGEGEAKTPSSEPPETSGQTGLE